MFLGSMLSLVYKIKVPERYRCLIPLSPEYAICLQMALENFDLHGQESAFTACHPTSLAEPRFELFVCSHGHKMFRTVTLCSLQFG